MEGNAERTSLKVFVEFFRLDIDDKRKFQKKDDRRDDRYSDCLVKPQIIASESIARGEWNEMIEEF